MSWPEIRGRQDGRFSKRLLLNFVVEPAKKKTGFAKLELKFASFRWELGSQCLPFRAWNARSSFVHCMV